MQTLSQILGLDDNNAASTAAVSTANPASSTAVSSSVANAVPSTDGNGFLSKNGEYITDIANVLASFGGAYLATKTNQAGVQTTESAASKAATEQQVAALNQATLTYLSQQNTKTPAVPVYVWVIAGAAVLVFAGLMLKKG